MNALTSAMIGTTDVYGVIGATGKTGRRVAVRLAEAGVGVRRLSRGTGFDWTDRSTWPDAVRGLRGLYVAYHADFLAPGATENVVALARAAAEAGIERLVLLTGRNEAESEHAEAAARIVFPGLTAVRAAWFVQNLTEGDMAGQLRSGTLALPVGDVPEPFVDAADIADVAAASLLDDLHAGASYEVTGADALTFAELAELLAPGTTYLELTLDQARAAWSDAGLPDDAVSLLATLFGTVFDGRNTEPGKGVLQALGREPHTVRQAAD